MQKLSARKIVYKNVCLMFLSQKSQKLEIVSFDKFLSNLRFFSIFTKLKKKFFKYFSQLFALKSPEDAGII